MAGVHGAAVVPAAPLLVAAAVPTPPAADASAIESLRADVHGAIGALPRSEVVLLLAEGAGRVHDHARASLAPLGLAGIDAELPVPSGVVTELARITRFPLVPTGRLGLSLSVLALLVHERRGTVPVVPVEIPAAASAEVLLHIGAAVVEVVRAADVSATIVAAGDLAATLTERSPRFLRHGAAAWDERVIDAFRRDEPRAIADLGPGDAERFAARSWASLVAVAGLARAAGLRTGTVAYHAPRGVGQLVATLLAPEGVPAAGH